MFLPYLSMIEDEDDKVTFESIYQKYGKEIFRRTYNLLKNQQDAEDAMQETWLKIMENIEVLQGKSDRTVKAYIMKIAKNESISIMRKRGRDEKMLCAIDDIEIVSDEELFQICEKNDISAIVSCFAELSETYRDVLSFYYFYHHSIKEIARLMNMNEATINSRLTRGKKQLIELLKRRGYHE